MQAVVSLMQWLADETPTFSVADWFLAETRTAQILLHLSYFHSSSVEYVFL